MNSTPSCNTRGKQGVTLIETIAVLVILGIFALIAVPRFIDTGADVKSEAAILKLHLRYTQSLAMANNVAVWEVAVNPSSYTLMKNGAPSPYVLPGEKTSTHTFRDDVTVTAGGGTIQFDEYGDAGPSGQTIVLNGTEQITVTPNTGFVP